MAIDAGLSFLVNELHCYKVFGQVNFRPTVSH